MRPGDRLVGRHQGVVNEAIRADDISAGKVHERVEVAYFAGNLAGERGWIELRDAGDATDTRGDRRPEGFDPDTDRRDDPHPCHDHASNLSHGWPLPAQG